MSPRLASAHVGQAATVCGAVASANYAPTSSGAPTYLNLDEPYPGQVFTILIWVEDRAAYGGAPEVKYAGNRVCIKGLIESYNGTAQIVARGQAITIYR